jgi:signal transduction histidine kinase
MKDDPAGQTAAFRVQTLDDLARLLDTEVSYLAWELRPTTLDQFGLIETLRLFVQEWSKQCGIPGEFEAVNLSNVHLEKDAETHLYRITQEALNNIAKHAGASIASVHLSRSKDSISLIIEDDGDGFTTTQHADSNRTLGGNGLSGMHERASLIGGTVEVDSRSGEGTTIFVRIPQRQAAATEADGPRPNDVISQGGRVS